MADVAIENHELERLGFTKDMEKSPQKLSPDRQSKSTIRRTIVASRSRTKLMRQVSALGMEDPVFRTTESGPMHPSNIFDDMGASDIPTDMQDMVSIASDPTAVSGDGLDSRMLMSLNEVSISSDTSKPKQGKRRPSLLDSVNQTEQQLGKLFEGEESPTHMESTSTSDTNPLDTSTSRESISLLRRKPGISMCKSPRSSSICNKSPRALCKSPRSMSLNKSPRKSECRTRLSSKRQPTSKEGFGNSIQSLDLENIFGKDRLKDQNGSSRGTRTTTNSDDSNSMHDTLLAEAARAMEKQGSVVSRELIKAAKSQHSTSMGNLIGNGSGHGKNNGGRRMRHSVQNPHFSPIKEGEADVELGDDSPRRRVMPTISGLFPLRSDSPIKKRHTSPAKKRMPQRTQSDDGCMRPNIPKRSSSSPGRSPVSER